jgi:hypothetical protein
MLTENHIEKEAHMTIRSEIKWFIDTFGSRVSDKIEGTPLTLELMAGIAYQETGYMWRRIRRVADNEANFLLYCVGDVIDDTSRYPRRAFPRNRTALIKADNGKDMYDVARIAVERIGSVVFDYAPAARDPKKFCRGFGIFQYDLQHFKIDPQYFLTESWKDFDLCLQKALDELIPAAKKMGFSGRVKLGARDAASVAIAYNTGRYIQSRGLRQGYKVGGRYYGELVYDHIRRARKILSAEVGQDLGEPSEIVEGLYVANARPWLNLRSLPGGEKIGQLLPGTEVSVMGPDGEWVLVDLQGDGVADGYVHKAYLDAI